MALRELVRDLLPQLPEFAPKPTTFAEFLDLIYENTVKIAVSPHVETLPPQETDINSIVAWFEHGITITATLPSKQSTDFYILCGRFCPVSMYSPNKKMQEMGRKINEDYIAMTFTSAVYLLEQLFRLLPHCREAKLVYDDNQEEITLKDAKKLITQNKWSKIPLWENIKEYFL